MNLYGYQRRDIYDTFQKWWLGDGSLTAVEDMLGAKRPFLWDFFFQAGVLGRMGFKAEDVTFQDAFNLLILHLVLLGIQAKKVQPVKRKWW